MPNENTNKLLWTALVLIEYFVIFVAAYFFSLKSGNLGLAIDGLTGQNDSYFYYNQIIANMGNSQLTNESGTLFIPVMTMISHFFNSASVFLLKFINFMGFPILLVAIMNLVNSISKVTGLAGNRVSSEVMFRMAIFPSSILAVAIPFGRDVWIYVFFMLSVRRLIVFLFTGHSLVDLIFFIVYVYLLYGFRAYAALSVVIGALVFFLIRNISKSRLLLLISVGIISFIVWFQFFSTVTIPVVGLSLADAIKFQSGVSLNELGMIVNQRTGGSDFMGVFNTSDVFVFVAQIIFSYIGNLISPFIWQLDSVSMFPIFIFESLPMIYLIGRLLRKKTDFVVFLKINPALTLVVSQVLTWWTMLAITNKNVGTGMRLKVPLFIFIWIVYYFYIGFKKKKDERSE